MFKRGNTFFMLTSAATGWNPNQARYATASSISGPWSGFTNVGDTTNQSGTGDGADIQQWSCHSGNNQQWSRTQV